MMYYTYQHADGTNDVGPYHPYENYNYAAMYQTDVTEYAIMVARTKASLRGALPAEIQRNVMALA